MGFAAARLNPSYFLLPLTHASSVFQSGSFFEANCQPPEW